MTRRRLRTTNIAPCSTIIKRFIEKWPDLEWRWVHRRSRGKAGFMDDLLIEF